MLGWWKKKTKKLLVKKNIGTQKNAIKLNKIFLSVDDRNILFINCLKLKLIS